MGDQDKITTRYHYEFIHNVYGHFFKDTLSYFSAYLYPRFRHTVVGTYDKAVEYLNKQTQYGREDDLPNLPALILNPSGEFNISDLGGKQLWRFPNLEPGFIKRVFNPIYQDANVLITVGFTRIKGEFELLALLPSFYEYCDVKMYFLQIFGGTERIIYPQYFNSFIIIPDELYNYRYTNPYTGEDYQLRWDETDLTTSLVRTTNRTEYVFPCRIKPWYKLTGISDGSTKYGGADKLADWRLTSTIEYEIEIPSFLVLESDYLAENIHFEIRYGSAYSAYGEYNNPEIPINREIIKTHWDIDGVDATSVAGIVTDDDYPTEATITERSSLIYHNRYFHIITQSEVDSTADIEVTMPLVVTNKDLIILNSSNGIMYYGDHYTLNTAGTILTVRQDTTSLMVGDILELYIYQEIS